MTTKASDVLELATARALLGCSSTMSLVDGVRALKADAATVRAELEHSTDLLRQELRLMRDQPHGAMMLSVQIERNQKALGLL